MSDSVEIYFVPAGLPETMAPGQQERLIESRKQTFHNINSDMDSSKKWLIPMWDGMKAVAIRVPKGTKILVGEVGSDED